MAVFVSWYFVQKEYKKLIQNFKWLGEKLKKSFHKQSNTKAMPECFLNCLHELDQPQISFNLFPPNRLLPTANFTKKKDICVCVDIISVVQIVWKSQ